MGLLDYLITCLSTTISVYATMKFSSNYHVRKPGKACEKCMVLEKLPHRRKKGVEDIARIVIVKSSIKNALGFMDVEANYKDKDQDQIIVRRYAFIHSFTHVCFAPGKILLKREQNWKEKVESNNFRSYYISSRKELMLPSDLAFMGYMEKIKKISGEFLTVRSTFEYPKTYTGPRYKERIVVFGKGIGIIHARMVYSDGDKDVYMLRNFKVKKYFLVSYT